MNANIVPPDRESPENEQPTPRPITMERVLEILQCGSVDAEHGMMRWSSNYTFLVSVVDQADTIMAVYKPRRGERPLWDFPDGTLYRREVAAFTVSQALGWQLVPPTIAREGQRGIGSMQFFVDHDPEHNYFSFDEQMHPQLMRMCLFDAITNNADRKGGHCLVDSQGHLWGIDQGLTFNVAHKLRTVIWDFEGQSIADDLLADLDKLCSQINDRSSSLGATLAQLLAPGEIGAFESRLRRLLKSRRYPQRGPGPNYPWPPV